MCCRLLRQDGSKRLEVINSKNIGADRRLIQNIGADYIADGAWGGIVFYGDVPVYFD